MKINYKEEVTETDERYSLRVILPNGVSIGNDVKIT